MPRLIPAATLRENLADTLNTLSPKEKYFLVTKNGKPVSALVNLDFFEDLLALSSPKYLESVQEARAEYKAGKTHTHDEIFGAL